MPIRERILRYFVIGGILLLAAVWSLASAGTGSAEGGYPNADLLASADWLKGRIDDPDLIIVDVRTGEHFDGKLIPGAIRLPWSSFRYNDTATNTGSLFVGTERAQEILGEHGIGRTNEIVLYDSVERDGGATASYLFWVLDVLGHEKKRVLEGGLDAWKRAGYDLDSRPKQLSAVLYQAPIEEIQGRSLIDGDFVYRRLGDPYYQIIDVRSRAEYLGEKGSRDLRGNPLKLGHIPTAVNIDYTSNWADANTKTIKPYPALQNLYRGLDPNKGVIVYCASGRRSSFSYFILRLMGVENVYTYEASWLEWGNPAMFYPVETMERKLAGSGLPTTSVKQTAAGSSEGSRSGAAGRSGSQPKGGYVSCGG
ncbi:MAG: sulfurtransferase [Desulfobacterales bacterium]|nr:sulfurtransferase [Desulfobacterales bacterium]